MNKYQTLKYVIKSEIKNILKEDFNQDFDKNVFEKTVNEINKKLKSLKISANLSRNPTKDDKLTLLLKTKINPDNLGLFKYVFEEIEMEVWAGVFNSNLEGGKILLKYAWRHPSGTNGYMVTFLLDRNKWEEQ